MKKASTLALVALLSLGPGLGLFAQAEGAPPQAAVAAPAPSPEAGPAAAPVTPPAPTLPAAPAAPAAPATSATSAAVVLNLEGSIASALSKGEDAAIAARTLDAALAAHAINLAKDKWSISASGAYTLGDGLMASNPTAVDKSLLAKAGGSYTDISQSLSASLSLSTGNASTTSPGTRITLNASETLPPASAGVDPVAVLGFSLAQTVWDGYRGGQTRAVVEKSLIALTTKKLQAELARSTIRSNVKKAYVTMLSAQRALALKLTIADKQRALLSQIEAIYAIRQATTIDLQTARINSLTANLDVETGRHDLALARQRLANLIGLPSDADFTVAETEGGSLPAASLEDATALGLSRRLELAVADLNAKSSGIDLALAQGQSEPGVSLTGGITTALGSDKDASYATLGLRLSLPVLDGGSADSQASQARALVASYAAQRRLLERTISADIRDAWWMASISRQRIDLASQSRDLYESQLTLVKAQNSFGTATNQDLLTASVNAANAASALATAKYNYLLAVLALETAMGL